MRSALSRARRIPQHPAGKPCRAFALTFAVRISEFNFQFTRTAGGGVYSTSYAGAVISSGYNYMIAEGDVLYNISREDDELTASKDLMSNLAEDMLPPYFFNI